MSEFQYVGFRAIDRPISGKNLKYMEQQSTRAEITGWKFDNEYHYGAFRGNAVEMLRRGYDIHLHYANFGTRKLLIRFPRGLPDRRAAEPYFVKNSLEFLKDKHGVGGILSVEPFHEIDDLEDLWDVDQLLDKLASLRAEIQDGDLRPLYLAHLAAASDAYHEPGEMVEGPVPAGLGKLTSAQRALAQFFSLGKGLISAAAKKSSPLPKRANLTEDYAKWLKKQSALRKDRWLSSLMADAESAVRAEVLALYKADLKLPPWPTQRANRTIAQLYDAAEGLTKASRRKAEATAARNREKQLASMAADPAAILRQTERLVEHRTIDAYIQIGRLLADLREALSPTEQSHLAEAQAKKLKAANPKLAKLVGELRRQGFVPK